MTGNLQRVRINGLHGYRNFDVSIADNKLIIVGENGSGKTTLLRTLFHFLGGRWLSLAQTKFVSITATISGSDYKITYEDIEKMARGADRRLQAMVPNNVRRRLRELMETAPPKRFRFEIERISASYHIPSHVLFNELEVLESSSRNRAREHLEEVQHAIGAQILYLPTYRRIERELSSILEGTDPDELRRPSRYVNRSETDLTYIELVEFGMKDVELAIRRTLDGLKEFARENLNNLTLRYLGDVVDKAYQTVDMNQIGSVSEDTVRTVLSRIDDRILNKAHKQHLSEAINSAKSGSGPTEHEKIICHYFLRILAFQESLQERERYISSFFSLCSEYMIDKKFIYDSSTYGYSLLSNSSRNSAIPIELSDLSSGEKQVVSLFSHLYLSGSKKFFVLIDEPELSLSVPWQRRFLTDICKGEYFAGLVAVTHSPFIYENELRKYAHSLGEFTGY